MQNKNTILEKMNELKEYSVDKDSATAPLFDPVYSAIESYFGAGSNGLADALREVVQYMYNDLTRRTTSHEHEFEMGLATDYPLGYNDVTDCFYTFAELLSISPEIFFDAFVYGQPETSEGDSGGTEGDSGGTELIPISNPYLTRWQEEITAAIPGDIQKVQALADWCKNSGGNCDLVCLLENQGRVVAQKTQQQKATIIYVDRKVLEVINTKNVDVYIPTYLRS